MSRAKAEQHDGRDESRSGSADRAPDGPDPSGGDEGAATPAGTDASQALDRADLQLVLVGGGLTALVLFTAIWGMGTVGEAEARILLEAAAPALRFLASASITAGATVLALMLTVLGLSDRTSRSFKDIHYRRIQRISVMAVALILLAVIHLMFLGVPLEESDALRAFYSYLYYGFLTAGALLGGIFVAMVLMLTRTVLGLAQAFSPHLESRFTEE